MKKLVVYYSYTGNTKRIAEMISKRLACDILEVKPRIPFSSDYDAVVEEYQNNSIDNKEVKIEDISVSLEEYDDIIVGFPVWWYTINPVIVTFLKSHDLTGKKVYSFATNAGWLGHSFLDFHKLCLSFEQRNGINIVFDSENREKLITSEEKINGWIDTNIGDN